MECTSEDEEVAFPSMVELVAHRRNGHKPLPAKLDSAPQQLPHLEVAPTPPAEIAKKSIPIRLVYKYEGTCEECSGELDTIGAKVGEKVVMIAYCPACKKQHTLQEVIPIGNQTKD